MNKVYASSIAGISAELITLPISTLKSIYQTSENISICQIISDKNYKGYIRKSISPAIVQKLLSTTSRFTTFYYLKNKDNMSNMKSGFISGIVSSIITTPANVWKIRKQIGNIYSIKNSYNGVKLSIVRNILLGTLQLPLYEYMKRYTKENHAYASIITAIIVTAILHPIDLLMTKKMAGKNLLPIGNIYKGISLNLGRVLPHFMIVTYIYEKLSSLKYHS